MQPSPTDPAAARPTVDATRSAIRAEMPVTERWAYFDHAAVAPLSGPAQRAIRRWADEAATEGDTRWPAWDRQVEQTRCLAAQLVGAEADAIALMPSTTAGINLVADGVDWREGDNVVVLADEFPSNLYPWMQQASRGVETRLVSTDVGRVDLDRLREACDARTRVVSVSWVGFATGYRQDIDAIAEIAHASGGASDDRAYFFLDAIQGLGVLPLDVASTPIDFLAADGHKWMLGPEGAGVAYVRPVNLERLRPMGVGWNSVVGGHDFSSVNLRLKPSASRYEGGSANMPGMHALGASLGLLQSGPAEALTAAVLDITDYLCERLRSIGAEVASHRDPEPSGHDPRSGIVVCVPPGGPPEEARRRCGEAGVAVSVRGGRLRVSAHAYNDRDDVDRLIEAIAPPSS